MDKKKVLVVDDEPDILQLLEISLSRMGLTVYQAENVGSAKYELEKNSFHLCLTDFKLPDGTGLDLVEFVNQNYSDTPIAVITAFGTINHAVEALKKGAFDFITKPISLDTLRNLVVTGLNLNQSPATESDDLQLFAGVSDYVESLNEKVTQQGKNTAPVMIYGDKGTDKIRIAKKIHQASGGDDENLHTFDCEALAAHERMDFLDEPIEGTVLFKRIQQLSLDQQGYLQRFLQDESSNNVRIIGTVDMPYTDLYRSVGFKKSLLRQLNINRLDTLRLEQRKEDLPHLCKEILEGYAKSWGKLVCKINPQAMGKLSAYDFPGNVQELDLILAKAAVNCSNQLIRDDDLELDDTGFKPHISSAVNLEKYIEEIEIREIKNALSKTGNNKTKAAEALGISFRALRYKISKLNIEN